jgi:hypothetical protein
MGASETGAMELNSSLRLLSSPLLLLPAVAAQEDEGVVCFNWLTLVEDEGTAIFFDLWRDFVAMFIVSRRSSISKVNFSLTLSRPFSASSSVFSTAVLRVGAGSGEGVIMVGPLKDVRCFGAGLVFELDDDTDLNTLAGLTPAYRAASTAEEVEASSA